MQATSDISHLIDGVSHKCWLTGHIVCVHQCYLGRITLSYDTGLSSWISQSQGSNLGCILVLCEIGYFLSTITRITYAGDPEREGVLLTRKSEAPMK